VNIPSYRSKYLALKLARSTHVLGSELAVSDISMKETARAWADMVRRDGRRLLDHDWRPTHIPEDLGQGHVKAVNEHEHHDS
jgi:hypothetical protein